MAYKKYNGKDKIKYYNDRLFDDGLDLNKRVYASYRLKSLSEGKTINKSIPIKLSRKLRTPTWANNYVLGKGATKGSHVVLPIDKNNDRYAVLGVSSQDKTKDRKNLPIKNIEHGKKSSSYVVLELKTKKAKGGGIKNKDFISKKVKNRPLRRLKAREKVLILNAVNLSETNRNNYNY